MKLNIGDHVVYDGKGFKCYGTVNTLVDDRVYLSDCVRVSDDKLCRLDKCRLIKRDRLMRIAKREIEGLSVYTPLDGDNWQAKERLAHYLFVEKAQ
jgi:hypothetical protein